MERTNFGSWQQNAAKESLAPTIHTPDKNIYNWFSGWSVCVCVLYFMHTEKWLMATHNLYFQK